LGWTFGILKLTEEVKKTRKGRNGKGTPKAGGGGEKKMVRDQISNTIIRKVLEGSRSEHQKLNRKDRGIVGGTSTNGPFRG